MNELQHTDSIWTWSSSGRKSKASLWIPYLQSLTKANGSKGHWDVAFNGGDFCIDLNKVEVILFYGASGDLPLTFLDDLAARRIPALFHRRNLPDPYVFVPAARRDDADMLTAQIMVRQNAARSCLIARILVRERFKATKFPIAGMFYKGLSKLRNVKDIRLAEAHQSKTYWEKYFADLGLADTTRRSANPVSAALDAGSFFLYGILLRWVLMHKMSPAHGFLHVTTGYPSLVYDLMEPYRYMIEDAVAKCVRQESKDLTAATLGEIKTSLDEVVYAPSHRTHVRRKNLLHGAVLSLRSYLQGETKRLVLPTEGGKIGGRPPKMSYALPGANAKVKVVPG
ncbi:MAG: CRISPR-associated endonuclease Cas1 [Rhodoferax sp.]|nr:CRISPR-associated endonuclease Cas1 [Rhodoferax sp.]